MKPGRVYLIGAGPGEPALISVRGLRHLGGADIVVHDRLVHARQLRAVRPDAQRVDAATVLERSPGPHAVARLLAEKAAAGQTVARLIHGDPFEHGAGEAAALRARGVPFEVVPGIPQAIGDCGFAGIPLGHPDAGDAVLFVNARTGRLPDTDRAYAASPRVTVVAQADAAGLRSIMDDLLAAGRAAGDPAALIIDGTLPTQRTIDGRLGDVSRTTPDVLPRGSGVLVVGQVVELRQQLRWFDNRPLSGRRVLVTRAREQSAELVDRLVDLGAEPVEAPTIRIAPPDDYGPLDAACADAESFDWIVFTSVNGVDAFLERLLAGPRDIRALGGVRLCAIGPATAGRLRRHGLKVDVMPAEHRAEAVFDALRRAGRLAGARVLLARADIARAMLADALRAAGAEVTEATAYRTVRADGWSGPELHSLLREQPVDVVTFTSASTARNFAEILGAETAAELLAATPVASIGPVTAAAAAELGIETRIMPAAYTIPALVEAIADHFAGAETAEKTETP
ncbi:MAG: uroporphyrinogen-III synthase [Acidobacteria bacterium]|nr:uroporphyrinogen-III synthase [Acidobacteriota bacterium]